MGRAVRDRDGLLEWGLQIDNNGRRCAHDAYKWEVFEEVLRMIVFTFLIMLWIRDDYFRKGMNCASELIDYTPSATTKAWEGESNYWMLKPNFGGSTTISISCDNATNSRINHVGRNEQIDAYWCPN